MLKVLELFGGIAACSKALERIGIDFEVVDYVEIDKYAVKSYNAIHNTNFQPQDIMTYDKDLEVDLIMHGSPCQDFSLAGKQAGGDKDSGTRSSLMFETLRIVEKLKPTYVIWENVKNVISKRHKHNFDEYLKYLEKLGYTNYWQVLNAKDYGIPQNRERVFVVSILNNQSFDFPKRQYNKNKINRKYGLYGQTTRWGVYDKNGLAPTLTASMGMGGGHIPMIEEFTFPPKQELKLKLKDILESEVDEKYYLSDDKIKSILNWKAHQKPFERVQGNNSIVPTLTARGAGEEHSGMIIYSEKLDDTTNLDSYLKFIKDTENYIQWYEKGHFDSDCRAYKGDKVIGTITPNPKKVLVDSQDIEIGLFDHTSSDAFANGKRDYGYRDVYGTLKCNPKYSIYSSSDLRIRKLTPKECWRLMGFDDSDFEKAQKVNSNTQLYKQAGNSIVVNVLDEIFKNLLKGE